jgi:hypothetical protein
MPLVPQEIKIPAGQTADLWFGVNVKGKIYYAIRSRSGADRAKLWWIKWGVGSIEEIGERAGGGELTPPSGILDVSYKLRAEVSEDTIFYISDTVKVNNTLTFKW